VGQSGTFLSTTDGGTTWAAQTLNTGVGPTAGLSGLSCPSITTCYVVGFGAINPYTGRSATGSILASTDGATTWALQTASVTTALASVSCPSTTTCFAVGQLGAILATTTGGTGSAATGTTLTGSTNPSPFAQTVIFTATVRGAGGTPSGSVSFSDGHTVVTEPLDGSGNATFSTSSLGAGTQSIAAAYGGDTAFAASRSSTLSETITAPVVLVQPGWNLISLPAGASSPISATTVLTSVLQSGGGNLAVIYTLRNNQWSAPVMLRRGSAPLGADFALRPGVGYLLYSDHAGSYLQTGAVSTAQPSWSLTTGWNLVGPLLGSTTPISASTVLAGVLRSGGGGLAAIYALHNNQWSTPLIVQSGYVFSGADFTLQPGRGYLLYTDIDDSYTLSATSGMTRRTQQAGSAVGPRFGSGGQPPPPSLPGARK
jgi:hypothetical protein